MVGRLPAPAAQRVRVRVTSPCSDNPRGYEHGNNDGRHDQQGRNPYRLIDRAALLHENFVGALKVPGVSNVDANGGKRFRVEQGATGSVAVNIGPPQRVND